MKRLKIGITGCGAIGSSLAKAVIKDFSREAELTALYDINPESSRRLSQLISKGKDITVSSLQKLISCVDLVIESASAKVSFVVASQALAKGKDVMIMSTGGLAGHFEKLLQLAKKNSAHLYIPSGAIAGVDALKALNLSRIKKVVLTTYKNPRSFEGVEFVERKGIKLSAIRKDKVLFSGTAREAVKYFPQNINVASILSIAGIGSGRTQVKIVASPKTKRNIHQIEVDSDAGRIFARTENVLHPSNPKTSYLAVLSAVATLRQILHPIKIGT